VFEDLGGYNRVEIYLKEMKWDFVAMDLFGSWLNPGRTLANGAATNVYFPQPA
jgi:hypothetical protein